MSQTPIFLNTDLQSLTDFIYNSDKSYSKVFILVDENTHELCLPILNDFVLAKNDLIEIIEIESGESQKSIANAEILIDILLEYQADKNALIIILGGGVLCDLGGFVASIFKRGIAFINIPTTLLAMVDASLGGKTGVNIGAYKNQVGSFYNAEAIFVFPEFLKSLPDRELKSGFAEIVKYCLIDDLAYFEAIEDFNYQDIKDWENLIQLSMTIKSEVVTNDPHENGIRKILNFGHTIGHAIESISLKHDENPISHGEAIAAGILMESWISTQRLNFSFNDFQRIEKFILKNFQKYTMTFNQFDEILLFLKHDKKNLNAKYFPVLLKEIGKPDFETAVDEVLIRQSIDYYIALQ